MILQNVDSYRVMEPLFEGVRIILSYLGESYSPEYIQGVSGAGFVIAGGCASRPTCVYNMWTTDFIRYMGYEITEYPCVDKDGNTLAGEFIAAVRRSVDEGKPALVWNAFTNLEWDVVCGYDEAQEQFIGRGSYLGAESRESWNRAAQAEIVMGAILFGEKQRAFDTERAELDSLRFAVGHARKTTAPENPPETMEGIQFYRRWADDFAHEGRARITADAYCHQVYAFARKAVVGYLREIAPKYETTVGDALTEAAAFFEQECECLSESFPYISWWSPEGVDEERSQKVAPILAKAAEFYEKGIECIEKALAVMERKEKELSRA